jgi:acetyl esterase/lipase
MVFRIAIILIILLSPILSIGQADSTQKLYLAEQKVMGNAFSSFFYSDPSAVYSLVEKEFVFKIDSFRTKFNNLLNRYHEGLTKQFVTSQEEEIRYYFDRLILDFPENHKTHTGKKVILSPVTAERLKANLFDFNKPALLGNSDFREYVKAYIHHKTNSELTKPKWKKQDNQYLNVAWQLISTLFTDPVCRQFWKHDYLYNHIDNVGISNIEKFYRDFLADSRDSASISKIRAMYAEDSAGRQDHLIRMYKSIEGFKLNMHVFLPDDSLKTKRRPAILFFHGGSWSEGKPDWFFETCKAYARKGWVACAVEYRIVARHNTLPFDAVKDARSAIRWIRQNASEYSIDTNKIIASGNSAGGHLVLTTALADNWNERTDDLRYGAIPNIALVNAGVYDLTDRNTAWIRAAQKDEDIVKQISPLHLVKKIHTSFLIIHGTKDRNCPFPATEEFARKMKQVGNSIEFYPLEGAEHFIWYDPKYGSRVSAIRNDFLIKLGY